MINIQATLYLLAFPIGLMGLVQAFFAWLSLWVFDDHHQTQFLTPALLMLLTTGLFLWVGRRFDPASIKYRDALLFATLTWVICSVLGAVPIIYITGVSFTDGVFESVSALTTTGATVLSGLDSMPKSFLMYRQFLQWLGGLGVVIFVVAILPMLNVGGMKLLKAETPGPIKDDKLSPRISLTTQYLWLVYVALTLLCALCYFLGGMDAFDAICHSFTTVSTGGFSTHDASMGYFQSPSLLLIADVFMVLGAVSFALHFKVIRSRNLLVYLRDEETRTFLAIVLLLSVLIAFILLSEALYQDSLSALNQSVFHLISFITSTGYGAAEFTAWPNVVLLMLVIAGYLGGCAGSTAGGNKIIRIILSFKLINLELKRLIHPRAVFNVKYQGRPVDSSILAATVAFMNVAAASTLVLTLLLMATGLDFWSALSGVAACLNVLGPGLGSLGSNFEPVSDAGIWVLSVAMILGRLEYFTVLALLLPAFWKY
ncbi:MAG: TrkH family potassium uptake protein [Pseudomonadota bacterium]|nr:TrkH family potassium uptake protein [Pseudomonadota bacterium]